MAPGYPGYWTVDSIIGVLKLLLILIQTYMYTCRFFTIITSPHQVFSLFSLQSVTEVF